MLDNCAIVGATGLVGQELLTIMNKDSGFKFKNLFLYSSSRGKKSIFEYKSRKISVEPFDEKNLPHFDIVFSSMDENLSRKYVPVFLDRGCYVIDDSSAFRLDKSSALVVYGINDELIRREQKLYCQPNCVVIGIVYPIFLVSKVYKINRVYVSTYQSITGAGRKALEDFTTNLKNFVEDSEICLKIFKNDPVLNAIPVIPDSNFTGEKLEGFTKEEEKLFLETNRILGKNIPIISTCVRISVMRGHSATVFIELAQEASPTEIARLLENNEFIEFKNDGIYTAKDVVGKDKVYLCRLKVFKNILSFWVGWDNLRIGSAYNMWKIFTKLIEKLKH